MDAEPPSRRLGSKLLVLAPLAVWGFVRVPGLAFLLKLLEGYVMGLAVVGGLWCRCRCWLRLRYPDGIGLGLGDAIAPQCLDLLAQGRVEGFLGLLSCFAFTYGGLCPKLYGLVASVHKGLAKPDVGGDGDDVHLPSSYAMLALSMR